mmetsp:Transcript_8977/g.14614  ORF Transcript_8977/g.14614 Transcript_8977/m.14614 type:complete len:219 (+) Transcript_8977:1435-2091(+)
MTEPSLPPLGRRRCFPLATIIETRRSFFFLQFAAARFAANCNVVCESSEADDSILTTTCDPGQSRACIHMSLLEVIWKVILSFSFAERPTRMWKPSFAIRRLTSCLTPCFFCSRRRRCSFCMAFCCLSLFKSSVTRGVSSSMPSFSKEPSFSTSRKAFWSFKLLLYCSSHSETSFETRGCAFSWRTARVYNASASSFGDLYLEGCNSILNFETLPSSR